MWVTNESVGTVTPIDPARDVALTPITVGHGPNGIAVGPDAVWVTNSLDGTVSRIDPGTLVVATFPTGGDDPQGVAVVGDAVWVAARRSAKIVRLDAKTGQIRPSLAVGANPQDVAAVGDGAAITTTTSRTEHRGGTFIIAGAGPRSRIAKTIDPDSNFSYAPQLFDKLTTTNDGLVSYKRVPGPDGGTVVADLAQTLPTPTDGGRTYTFQLRRGIRYSTGRPVHASDIRHGLERTYSANVAFFREFPDADVFTAILGAPKCVASPRSCDLSRGIVADDKAGTVTFHLRHPDPDLLAKLATPQGVAVPPNVSRDDSGLHPLPATGPYMFSRYTLRRSVLVRNPYFHEWSADAQPDGYPDRIVWRAFKETSQAVSAVEHGTADWLYFTAPGLSTEQIHEIETNYAAQTHPFAFQSTDYLDVAPTSRLARDLLARQAIAYAIDRVRLGTLVSGGSSLFPERSTCRVIPPNFPGYRRDCSYRFEPSLAQQLAQRSPSYGKPVSVFSYYNSTSGRYVVDLLNALGFRGRLLPPDQHGEPTAVPDILLEVWAADYMGPSDFILSVHPGLITPSEVTKAQAKQTEGQYQGTLAWAAADRHLTDTAMVIPFGAGPTYGFTSKRVGNYQFAPAPGNSPIIDQMWVR